MAAPNSSHPPAASGDGGKFLPAPVVKGARYLLMIFFLLFVFALFVLPLFGHHKQSKSEINAQVATPQRQARAVTSAGNSTATTPATVAVTWSVVLPPAGKVHIPAADGGKSEMVSEPLGVGLCLGLNPTTDGYSREYHERGTSMDDANWHPVDPTALATNSDGERYEGTRETAKDMDYFYVHAGQPCV